MNKDRKILKGKRIALCVTGSISAYKSVYLASQWTQLGAHVNVLMSDSAKQFVGKSTFEGITHNKVIDSLWSNVSDINIDHLEMAKKSDVVVVVPATAHSIAKISKGLCDDPISATVIATTKPVIIAPAMDGNMYNHFTVKENIQKLARNGIKIIEPEKGYLASGISGKGRLAELETISDLVIKTLKIKLDLINKKLLVSAGGTREPIDSVRFIGNRSSGKMGHKIAEVSFERGGDVTLISASNIPVSSGIEKVNVVTSDDMCSEISERITETDCLIMAGAVSDFKPKSVFDYKIKKDYISELNLELDKTTDILDSIKNHNCLKVGFAAETENFVENGYNKLKSKQLDLIVVNDVSDKRIGFESDFNKVTLISKTGEMIDTEIETKEDIAHIIIDKIATLI